MEKEKEGKNLSSVHGLSAFHCLYVLQQVSTWFGNYGGERKTKKIYHPGQKVPLGSVIAHTLKEEIHDRIVQVTQADPGSHEYFGKYQKCMWQLYNEQGKEKQHEIKEIRQKWEDRGSPPEIQARCFIFSFSSCGLDAHEKSKQCKAIGPSHNP